MSVVDGDILRVVQHASMSSGKTVSTKFYLRAILGQPVERLEVLDAIEDWLADAYYELRVFCTTQIDLQDADVDIIAWQNQAWRTQANLGVVSPHNPFVSGGTDSPDQVTCLVTYTGSQPKVKRVIYQWGFREDRISGNYMSPPYLERLVNFGVAVLVPVVLGSDGGLWPVLVHALTGGSEFLTGFVAPDLVSAMHRRRPAG